jgi:hypothetical protein
MTLRTEGVSLSFFNSPMQQVTQRGSVMRVLVACEFSGIVRDAFIRHGCDAMSCDLLPSELPGPHYQGDVRDILYESWDLLVAFPPCTDLAVSGARWFKVKGSDRQMKALELVWLLLSAPIPRKAVENPVGVISTMIRKPDQMFQPWQFGHGECKKTCLWLYGLPPLRPTRLVAGRVERVHMMSPGPDRGRDRSRTYAGVAEAMADQWGVL